MKQVSFILSLFAIIILCGCSSTQGQASISTVNIAQSSPSSPVPLSSSSPAVRETKIELLQAMGATNISHMKPYDENTVYIIGSIRESTKHDREFIYAVCSLDTGGVSVLHREVISPDWAENMDVYKDKSGNVKLFTGQQIFTIDGTKVIDIKNVVNDEMYVCVDLKNNKMVFNDNMPQSLFYETIGGDDRVLIFEGKEGKEFPFPYRPQINDDGDKILYSTALGTAGSYQTAVISSIDGSQLAETATLQIIADSISTLWYKDGFIIIERLGDFDGSPNGSAIIFTQYNEKAKKTGKIILHGSARDFQRKIYPSTPLFAFSYETEFTSGLAIVNMDTKQAYYVRDVEIKSDLAPTVTPDGSKLLWFEDGYLCAEEIDFDKYEKLPTY